MITATIALGTYGAIAAGVLWANHRWHTLKPVEPEIVNWLPLLPPVPEPRRNALLTDQPVDVWLTPELSDRLFDEILAIEGLQ